ncbi:MAG: hypothetical protein GF330_04990 [Candidatus Eisenbacteria bacterium]|nr:hypothetical protein [Candidatus Eisenbacteria bacterium]
MEWTRRTAIAARGHRARFGLLAILLLLGAGRCILTPEEGFLGQRIANRLPRAQITAGVVEESTQTANRVRFYWYGADSDGVIRRFEWAVDDTVTERAWHWTEAFDAEIPFRATQPDSARRFSDWHTFFIRAVDNDGARSTPDRRYFNAHTIAPRSEIVYPPPSTADRWASTLRISWDGEDLDGSRADGLPAWYEYKLVRFESAPNPNDLEAVRVAFRDSVNVVFGDLERDDFPPDSLGDYYQQAQRAWKRVDGTEVDHAWLRGLDQGRTYGFALRAIDEAGAVEPEFVRNRNWVFFRVGNERIRVTLCEPSIGCQVFNNFTFGRIWEINVAVGQQIRFRWEGDASLTGSEPGPSNYGFDIPDPSDDAYRDADGRGGWIGWGNWTQMREPITFPETDAGKTHYFYLKMRDITNLLETETDCAVAIRVSRLSFSRKFLLVDDLYGAPSPCVGLPPRDAETDAWRVDLFDDVMEEFLPVGETWGQYAAFGDETSGAPAEIPSDFLETLGTYQNVIWDCGSGHPVGFLGAISRGLLSRYVAAGGNLLLMIDQGPVSQTSDCRHTQPDPCCPCSGSCLGQLWTTGSGFLWELLGLRGCIDKPRHPSGDARQMVGETLLRARAVHPLYPDLVLDPARWRCGSFERGLLAFEGLHPNAEEPEDDPWYGREAAAGELRVLYQSQTWEAGAKTDSLPVAWRTPGSSIATGRGRAVAFAFHPYYFETTALQTAMGYALRWVATGAE